MQLVSEIKDLILIIKLVNIPHMFILYFIRAILSKKYQSDWLKSFKKGRGNLPPEGGFQIKPCMQCIYKRMKWKNFIYMF